MSGRNLQVAKQFMVKELTSYQDELFCQLFRDISGFSQGIADRVFGQRDRRISIYGVRGLGKTTAMQGALWDGLREKRADKYIPVNVVALGARGVRDPRQLSEVFYKSVILGVNRVARASGFKNELAQAAARYAPWVARKITEAAGVVIGPIALASDLSENGVKWLVKHLGYSNIDSLLGSKDLDSQQAATLLIDKLEDQGGKLVFIIDELDKVEDDTVLSDFFDGNQAWFQGKQGMISLSYTFGESLSKTLVTSASRISLIERFPGVTSSEDAAEIIRRRAELGLSQIEKSEEATKQAAIKMIPDETVRAILNVSAPNSHIMLERASQAIDNALSSKAVVVSPDHVNAEPGEEISPTKLETSILQELTTGRLSPSIISDRLHRDRGLTTRTLRKMMVKDWVGRIGAGKRAYYFITAKGEAAHRRTKDS
jgi:Cdc6-like AAA superfamily ATPase